MYIISHYFNISETICILRQCNGILLISRTGTTHACSEVNIAVLNLDIAMILLNSMIYSYNYNFNESLDFPVSILLSQNDVTRIKVRIKD